jgi:predicted RNA methylase
MSDPPGQDPLPDGADGDVLAARYEAAIPEQRRAALGKFYTPPALARACCRWAITRDDGDPPRVLDPAAGGGAFVVAALDRLAALGADPATARQAVTAVDVDGDALAVARERAGDVGTREADFLALDPDDTGQFDAVVGNPPYVRQEGVDKDAARKHLAALGPEGATPYLDGDRALDRRSDAYVYFLTNATRFLRPDGRLAMVVPTKWLATRYGESLQRFLLDHHRIEAVVGFDVRAFDDALVDAAVLCCERRPDGAARRDGEVRFVRTAAGDADALADVLRGAADGAGTVAVDQATLDDAGPGKLAHYLDAPPALVDLLDHEALVPLSELAEVSYGQKTGANACFFLAPDDPVADRFRAPAVTSFRDVEGVVLEEDDVADEVLDVHGYVEAVLDGAGNREDPAAAVLDAMERDGYGETAAYLRRCGERYADRTTCAARRVWFDLGDLPRPAVLHPKFFDERVRVVHNRAGAVPSNAIDCLSLREGVPAEPLLGALNSSIYRAALECWGRAEGGGALQLMTYELQAVPAPDVRALSPAERERVAAAFRAYAGRSDACEPATDRDDQHRLDAAVLEALGADVAPAQVVDWREQLVARRVEDGHGDDG